MSHFVTIDKGEGQEIHINLDNVITFQKADISSIRFRFTGKSLDIHFDTVGARDREYLKIIWSINGITSFVSTP